MSLKEYFAQKMMEGVILYDATKEQDEEPDNRVFKMLCNTVVHSGEFALKVIPFDRAGEIECSPEEKLYSFVGEDWQAARLITPLAYWQDPETKTLYLILPLMSGSTLDDVLQKKRWTASDGTRLGLSTTVQFIQDLARSFQSLKDAGVLHFELVDNHFWVSDDGHLYLFDFEGTQAADVNTVKGRTKIAQQTLEFFQMVGNLLCDGVRREARAVEVLIHFDSVKSLKNSPEYHEICQRIEEDLGKSRESLKRRFRNQYIKYEMAKVKNIVDKYVVLETCLYAENLESRFGADISQMYVTHFHAAILDPNWSFDRFAEDFIQKLCTS